MVKAAYWALCTYVVLKFLQYFFVGRSGFEKAEPTARKKLLRGEPIVFIVACAISVPSALWSTWYFQRGYQRGFERSADCYGRLAALRSLPEVESEFDGLRIHRFARTAEAAASLAAQSLELEPAVVSETLAGKASFYAERYSSLSGQGDRQGARDQARAIERCMSEPLINF